MNNYITPFIRYNSYKELLDAKSLYGAYPFFDEEKFSFKELFAIERSLIISEPGYGKTRLLKEVVVQSDNYLKKAVFIDLKKVDKDLESFINKL